MSLFAVTYNAVYTDGTRSFPGKYIDAKTGDVLEASCFIEAESKTDPRLVKVLEKFNASSADSLGSHAEINGPLDVKPVYIYSLPERFAQALTEQNLTPQERATAQGSYDRLAEAALARMNSKTRFFP